MADASEHTEVHNRTGPGRAAVSPQVIVVRPASGPGSSAKALLAGLLIGAVAVVAGMGIVVLARSRATSAPATATTALVAPQSTTSTSSSTSAPPPTTTDAIIATSLSLPAPLPSRPAVTQFDPPNNRSGTRAYAVPTGGAPLKREPKVKGEDLLVIPAGSNVVAQCHFENQSEPPYPDFEYPNLVNRWWVFTIYGGVSGWVPDGRLATEGDARNFTNIPPCY